ncbi:hypothetical protein SCACP_35180 [Sporomusa carbonis]|uniref:site-specific DNA-methyltransferase n=1 Tax=Sporomusa carbonis TaxID=3076075 RepID=UPI003A73826F
MERMSGTSKDLTQENIQKLKGVFPEVLTEGKIDFDKLRLVLGDEVETREERYAFTWHGKSQAMKLAQTPSLGTLRPDKASSKNWDTTKNLYIEGDNLEVLKLLQASYFGKIKMIYIDPPYNTGNDFVYKDDFRDNIRNYKEMTGQTAKSNPETSGRYHTDWLNMMYPRLRLSRSLLAEDGALFISIDDNELSNLRKLCDEIMGEENFVGTFVWRRRASSALAEKLISSDHEYIVVYQKSNFIANGIPKDFANFSNPDNDPRGEWVAGDLTVGMTKEQRPNQYYDLIDPKTGNKYSPNPSRVWAYIPESMEKMIRENRIIFPSDTNRRPMMKRFKSELKSDVNPVSTWTTEVGLNSEATKQIQELFGEAVFSYSKPLSLIEHLLMISTTNNDIVLDFFSGSATTAHAVMMVNSNTGRHLRYIMVQLPELVSGEYPNICEIGKERIRRAGEKIVQDTGKTDLDIGFKVFKLDSSNIKRWNPDYDNLEEHLFTMQDNLVEGRTEEDLLYEILLKQGIDVTADIQAVGVNGKTLFNVGCGALLIFLADNIVLEDVTELVKYKSEFMDTKVVFRDSGFAGDTVKTNAIQILKQAGIKEDHVRSI